MTNLAWSAEDDVATIAHFARLEKAGIRPPKAGSPDAKRRDGALVRQAARERGERFAKAVTEASLAPAKPQLDRAEREQRRLGDSPQSPPRPSVHAEALLDLADRHAAEIVRTGGTGTIPTAFDPRNANDPSFFLSEANDQRQRASLAVGLARVGSEQALAKLQLHERLRRDPIARAAMARAERKAAAKGRPARLKDFLRAYRKVAPKGEVVKGGALGGIVERVVDLRVPR